MRLSLRRRWVLFWGLCRGEYLQLDLSFRGTGEVYFLYIDR